MASATGPQIRWVLERAGLPVAKRFVFMSVDDHVSETENDNEAELPPRLKKPISSASLATAVGNITSSGSIDQI